jgi:hypothetical protein
MSSRFSIKGRSHEEIYRCGAIASHRLVLSKPLSMYTQEQGRNQAYPLCIYIQQERSILRRCPVEATLYVYTRARKEAYILSMYTQQQETYPLCIYNSNRTYSLYTRARKEGSIQQEASIHTLSVYTRARKEAYILRRGVLSKPLSMYTQEQERKKAYSLYTIARKEPSRQEQGSIHTLYVYTTASKHILYVYTIGRKHTTESIHTATWRLV